MGIGGALAEARSEAGLTITEVSDRTRIRAKIIRDIEQDDYAACGGDYYARGHIRAIARVVGVDPVPLIEEYDAVHLPPPDVPGADAPPEHPPGWRMPGLLRLAGGGSAGSSDAGSAGPGSGHAGGQVANGTFGNVSDAISDQGVRTRRGAGRNGAGHDAAGHDISGPDGTSRNGAGPGDTAIGPAGSGPPDLEENADTDPGMYPPGSPQSPGIPGAFQSGPGGGQPRQGPGAATMAGALDSAARWAEAARSRFSRPGAPGAGRPGGGFRLRGLLADRDKAAGSSGLADADGSPGGYADDRPGGSYGGGVPGGITAAEAFGPRLPLQPRRTLSGPFWALALVVLVVIGLLIYFLVAGGSSPKPAGNSTSRHSAASPSHRSAGHQSAAPASSGHSTSATAPTSPVALSPLSVAAFGPGGTAHGDDPAQASAVIGHSGGAGWHSDWYATPDLGGLQPGTGLILDMGKPVSVSGVRLLLGQAAGGTVQLRVGNTPTLADLPAVAQAAMRGGSLSMTVRSPVTARYVLIWFTSLPPDSTGTYQVRVYNVSLTGTS